VAWTGSAPNQTFQRTDGTRTGQQVWQQADAAGVDIVAPDHDLHDQDMADAISSCLKKDGGNQATSNLPMGGFVHTNVGQATARTNYARASDVQDNRLSYCTVGGTANAIKLTSAVTVTSYVKGQVFRFFALAANTGPVTVSVDGLAAKALNVVGTALTAGQILTGQFIQIAYDGTDFEMIETSVPSVVKVGSVMAWATGTVPTGWLECDGSAISRSTYAALFSEIGTTYGDGDGSTTFNLPDYQGYFLRGHDNGSGNDPDAASRTDRGDGTTGDEVGTVQADDTKAHTHDLDEVQTTEDGLHGHPARLSWANDDGNGVGGLIMRNVNRTTATAYTGTPSDTFGEQIGGAGAHTHTVSGETESTGGNETRPKNKSVKWIILALPAASIATQTIAPYFTALTEDRTGSNADAAQAVFGSDEDTITLPPNTTYHFKALYYITRAAGSTSHTTSVLFGGTATFTSIMYTIESTTTTGAPSATTASQQLVATAATAVVAATTSTSTTENIVIKLEGIMRIDDSGTVIPQFKYSAAPGGAPTIKANSYFMLTPLGAGDVASSGLWS
jgi:microcystin-dependent protein